MNLETKEQKDLKIANCELFRSFEDKVLIHIEKNLKVTYKLFKLTEDGELKLLDEKIDSEWFYGSGDLGILHN